MSATGVSMHETGTGRGRPRPFVGPVERMAVFRVLHFGDMLCAVPALRALRAGFPDARITLIGLPWAEEFATRFTFYVDDFLAFPGGLGLPERRAGEAEVRAFVCAARARRFDVALQLHGSGTISNAAVAALGAREVVGFHPTDAVNPDERRFLAYPEDDSETRRLLRLVEFLGAPACGEELEFPIRAEEWRAAAGLRLRFGLRPGKFACLHVGARAPARRWLPERFARVADALSARGLQVVLTGLIEEAPLTRQVARHMHGACIDLAGLARGGVLAALLAGARLLVCNDTGVSHLAAALRVPSVVIFTGSSPRRWAPADRERHRVVFRPVDCRPCEHEVCPIGHGCGTGVSVGMVLAEVERLLG